MNEETKEEYKIEPHYYVPTCNYCGKLITRNDYMVHLRYPAFVTIHNNFGSYFSDEAVHTKVVLDKYYHKRCYNKIEKR